MRNPVESACSTENGEQVMYFRDLNEAVRAGMVKEIRFDIARDALYESGRLSAKGRTDWPDLLIGAAESGAPEALATELRQSDRLVTTEVSHRNGRRYTKAIPYNSTDTIPS